MIKTGIGLRHKFRILAAYKNLFSFKLRKVFLGFEYANVYSRTVDKNSLQLILKRNGAKISENCDIESGITFHNCQNYSNLKIGNNCHIGKNCFIDLKEVVEIGDNVTISMQCTLLTHMDLAKCGLAEIYEQDTGTVVIKNNVYLGAGCTVLMGNTLEEFTFIAAGSLVNSNIPSHTLVGGVPAKKIKKIK